MDLAAVFALALLGGYFFAFWWRVTAFATQRAEGHHLYFRAALCGAILFVLALLLRHLLLDIASYRALDARLMQYLKPALREEEGLTDPEQLRRAQWLIAALYSLIAGPLAAGLLNLVTPGRWAYWSLGDFDKLLLRAQRADMPVSLTLNNGKVYIGLVVSIPDRTGDPAVLTLLPMLSGQRTEQGRLVLTTDYERVYAEINERGAQRWNLPEPWLSQFELTLRVDNILSANLFSPAVYAEFNPGWQQNIGQRADQQPPEATAEG